MDNLAPAQLDPSEIPDGFTAAAAGGAGGDEKQGEAQSREAQKQAILEQALTPEALARLRRIKLVKVEKANAVESMIVSMAMQGKLPGRINEGRLIEMLEGMGAKQGSPSENKISIQRKKYAFDSDDDDDDDDLL